MKAHQNQVMKYDEMYWYESGMAMRRRTLREATNCLFIDIIKQLTVLIARRAQNNRPITKDHPDRS